MKSIKILGLAALAAIAVTALFGDDPASATVLCKAAETNCSAENTYPGGITLETSAPEIRIEEPESEVNSALTCKGENILRLNTNATEGTPLPVDFASTKWSNPCHHLLGSCELATTNFFRGTDGIEWTGGGATGNDGTLGPTFPQVNIHCGFWNCPVSSKSFEFEVHSTGLKSEPASLVATQQPLTQESLGCNHIFGPEIVLNAAYAVKTPSPLYVSQE